MADNRFQVLRKSISSWSLSTIAKPKVSGGSGKIGKFAFKPKIKLFSANKKNRAGKDDQAVSAPSAKEPLIPLNPFEVDGEVDVDARDEIHDPRQEDEPKHQPTIVLTADHLPSKDEEYESKHPKPGNVTTNQPLATDAQVDLNQNDSFGYEEFNCRDGQKKEIKEDKRVSNDNLRFIDDSPEEQDGKNTKTEAVNLNISPEEYYSWFDAHAGPLKLEQKDIANDECEEDYANYVASEYFDANDSRNLTPSSGKSYEDIAIPAETVVMLGSSKAREWVKSFNDEHPKGAEKSMIKCEDKIAQNLPRSRSEVQINNVPVGEKWTTKKDKIVLNAVNHKNNQSEKNVFKKIFSKENKKINNQISNDVHENDRKSEAEVVDRKESIKKIFGVRGKLSLKSPIIDSTLSSYKKTDIYIASTPYALTNTLKSTERGDLVSSDSLDTNDGNNLENPSILVNPNDKVCTADRTVDDTEELLKEIENYLYQPDNSASVEQPAISKLNDDLNTKEENREANTNVCVQHETDIHNPHDGMHKTEINRVETGNIANAKTSSQVKEPSTKNVATALVVESKRSLVSRNGRGVEEETGNNVLNESNSNCRESKLPCPNESSNVSDVPAENLSKIKTVEQSKATDERKKRNPGEYLSKTFKNIKQNILSSELKDKFKISEKRKKKIRIGPFRSEPRLKTGKNVITVDNVSTVDNDSSEGPKIGTNPFDETMDSVDNDEISDESERTFSESDTSNPFNTIQENNCEKSHMSDETVKNNSKQNYITSSMENEEHFESSCSENKNIDKNDTVNTVKNEKKELEIKSKPDKLEKEVKSEFQNDIPNEVHKINETNTERDILFGDVDPNIDTNTSTQVNKDASGGHKRENAENYKYANVIKKKTQTSHLEENVGKENINLNKYISNLPFTEIDVVEQPKKDLDDLRETLSSVPGEMENRKDQHVTIILNDEKPIFIPNKSQIDALQYDKEIRPWEKDTDSNINFIDRKSKRISDPRDKEFPLYENGHFNTEVTMEASPDHVLQQNTANSAIKGVATYPRPNPRTKRSKYSYCMDTDSKSLCNQNSNLDRTSFTSDETNPFAEIQNLPDVTIEEKIQTNNIGMAKTETSNNFIETGVIQKNLTDSGYRNGLTMDESSGTKEPIYWEIGEAPSAPKASPRKKKDKASNQNLSTISNTSQSSTNIPEWIQQRPPIPSPRSKKNASSQSLARESLHSSSDLQDGGNVFGSSFTNLDFGEPRKKGESKWLGEDFYSGKAASIAYGATTQRQPQKQQQQQQQQQQQLQTPTLPQRTKRSSMMSLPGAICNDESMVSKRKEVILEAPSRAASELAKKRLRRRTAPEVPPKMILPHRKKSLSPLQELQANLRYFLEIANSIHGGPTHHLKPDAILSEVLFSVASLMGARGRQRSWFVSAGTEGNVGRPRVEVSLAEVTSHLRDAFHVTPAQLQQMLGEAQAREAANVNLLVTVIEASDLRPKTVRGATNSYVTVDIPGTNQGHRTHMKHETLYPEWKQDFKLIVKNLHQDVVKLDVWHEFEASGSHQVSAVKDLKAFSRLVKGTKAVTSHQEAQLLGSVTVPLKYVCEKGLKEWFPLMKDSTPREEGAREDKPRGSLHVEVRATEAAGGPGGHEARRGHDALLARLIYHNLKSAINNNAVDGEAVYSPWRGHLAPEACAALAQHALIQGLTPDYRSLSWWIVGSRVSTADAGWQLKQLKAVQKQLAAGSFGVAESEELANSFEEWIKLSVTKLRRLRKSFPPTSGIVAKHQLSCMLAIFRLLESNKQLSCVLERKEIKDLKQQVREAVTDYMKIWWVQLIEKNLRGEMQPEVQIQKVIIITDEAHSFLCEIAAFYSPALLQEMDIPYFREMFLTVTKELNPCVRPPLMNLYNILDSVTETSRVEVGDGRKASTYTMEDGTNLWQLYSNLGKISKLGSDFPLEIRKQSGIYEYHKWFNKSVTRWVQLAKNRALIMTERAVNLDTFEPIDEYCDFSSSATDVLGIFTDVKIWWGKLEWPDPETCIMLLLMMLEDVCSYGMKYADLLKQKVEGMLSVQSNSDQLSISKQICIGLNNIEKIRIELARLPELFAYQTVMDKVKHSRPNGDEICDRFRNNINKITESSSENMEQKICDFIEAVIGRMSGTLRNAVVQSCDASSPLLIQTLDPALQVLHTKMNTRNFERFLREMWDEIIKHFDATVKHNTEACHKGNASFFNGVYIVLQKCLEFFSPCDDVGLNREEAKTKGYRHLIEHLECLRLSTESLISKYYEERYEEQEEVNYPSKGQLFVRAYFTKAGKLTVEIIMAKNMQLGNETGGLTSKKAQLGSQQIDAYVKVQLRPLDWFPNSGEVRTKTANKSDPAVFDDDDKFEFDLTKDANGVSKGFLLFTLKDSHLGWSNTFIGEALIPLNSLVCVDSSDVHSVQNTCLKLTQPRIESGYASLEAVRHRTGDRVATAFMKKLNSRLPNKRLRGGAGAGGAGGALSSDEERPRAKSPSLLQKIGL